MKQQNDKTKESRQEAFLIAEDLFRRLDDCGYKAAIVPIERLKDLGEEIHERNSTGQFKRQLFEGRYNLFDYNVSTVEADAHSIIIIAAPQPHVRLRLKPDNRPLSVIIPPTYSTRIDEKIEQLLREALGPVGHKFFRHPLPFKLLAVKSGLARYGRNNLAYVDGMGSYCRLLAFYTSLPTDNSNWTDPQMLEECEKCVACIRKCPTRAITQDRFLIRAERCLTFHNEHVVGFPGELSSDWHHCLIGCLYCQSYCPVDRKVNGRIEDCGTLDETDTAVLLHGGPPEAFSKSGRRLLDEFEFLGQLPQLSRNLKALLALPADINKVEKLLPGVR